jgi:hypothetical protein
MAEISLRLVNLSDDIREVHASLAPLEGLKTTMVLAAITSVILLAALTLALLTYGGDWFGAGKDVSAIVDEAAQRAIEKALYRQSLINSQPVAESAAQPEAAASPEPAAQATPVAPPEPRSSGCTRSSA